MAATYKLFPDAKLKYVTVRDTTNLAELRALAETYRKDPGYSPELAQLIDLSELRDADAKFIDVLTLRNFYNRTFGPVETPIRVAIFAPGDLAYGISRMFSSLMLGSSLMHVSIFDARDAALDWLGVPDFRVDEPAQ